MIRLEELNAIELLSFRIEKQKVKSNHFFGCCNAFLMEAQEYTLSLSSCFSINFVFLVFEQETQCSFESFFLSNSFLFNISLRRAAR